MEAETQRVTGGEKKPGKQSLISANSSMPGLGNTHTHTRVRAKTGMLNPPGICWHGSTPYAHVWHTYTNARTHAHTHGSVTVAIERGEGRGGGAGEINMKCTCSTL